MALNYKRQTEIEALSKQVGGSMYLSDLRTAMYGTNRRSEIVGKLGTGEKYWYDAWVKYILANTNKSSISSSIEEERAHFHSTGTYIMQVLKNMSGLIAYWPLNETSGNALDNSGLGNNGTVAGATQGATGKSGKCYDFDGSDDEITVPYTTTLDITTDQISIVAMVNIDTLPSDNTKQFQIIKHLRTTPTAGGYQLEINGTDASPNEIRWNFRGPADNYLSGTGTALTTGQWYFVAGTYDGANMKSFVNGVNDKTDDSTGNIDTNPQDLIIGGQVDAVNNIDGKLQHVAIFNRALTSDEVSRITRIANS